MLSTKAGIPIARIVGNEDFASINLVLPDDPQLYLKTHRRNADYDEMTDVDEDDIDTVIRKLTERGRNRFAIASMIGRTRAAIASDFLIDEGKLEPTVNLRNERDVLYVFGPSGSGKSHYIGSYINNYKRTYPDNRVILFSVVPSDPAIDQYLPMRVGLNYSKPLIVEGQEDENGEPYTVALLNLASPEIADKSLFTDSLVIFDDVDTILDRSIRDHVVAIRSDLLETGRHSRTSIAATSHVALNREKTKTMINESHFVTFFPSSGQMKPVRTFLGDYVGLTKAQIDKVLNLRSRWVTVHKNYPQYIFHEKGAFLTANPNPAEIRELKQRIRRESMRRY